ncbi:virion structural protein [Pseudomonas phage Phabio]|uniref:Virion structural protein n=1 Tax=Pseudomonas phage Phabio TaxID=2006668 RepID=A0A1Y0SW26_9CAUD|nr:virion structural protein [Pseudomonas phage Phabio]ARV76764.1 virion structural protein [Pseudomonas phage Phabio]
MSSLYKENIFRVRRNPALMQAAGLTELDRQLNPDPNNPTYDVPDGTLPFVFCMENSTMQTTMAINETEALMRKLYPRLALNFDELYLHMSDDDYIGRFSLPASTNMTLVLDYNEIIAKALPYGDQGLRRLVIPRLSSFTVDDLTFTMQYPITLTVQRHGGILAEYVLDHQSPVSVLTTNVVKWNMSYVATNEGSRRTLKLMNMSIPVQQFKIETHTDTLNPSNLFQKSYSFDDKFFFARAYISTDEESTWTEVKTTHSDLTYDPMALTVVLKVVDGGRIEAMIPSIYVTQGMVTGDIRLDIYTTKGQIDRDLAKYGMDKFDVAFNDIDDDSTYVAPMKHLSICTPFSRNRVDGGADPVTFMKLRDQVIDNTLGAAKVPITNVQLKSNLDMRGYDMVTNIDDISNLQYLATRRLGKPTGIDIVSGAGVTMAVLTANMETLAGSENVADNGDNITIKPSMLYRFNNGKVEFIADQEINRLKNLPAEGRAREVNNNRYVYSPFHNVLDAADNNFALRPYYLDNPKIEQKIFIGENDTANLQAAVDTYSISRNPEGYTIRVKLISGDLFKQLDNEQIVLQIGYEPNGENRWASVNGTFVGMESEERVYEFKIVTNYDINARNAIRTTNMTMFSNLQNNFYVDLESEFDVTICVVNTITPGYKPNELDDMVQSHLLPAQYMVVTRERLQTILGYDMTKMWRRSRPILGSESYQKYQFNIPAYYEVNVYAVDANGNNILIPDGQGGFTFELLHKAGDPVLTESGEPVMKHLAGDPILDAQGKPILIEPRKLLREITLFMVDGLFYFANELTAATYAQNIPMELVGWLQTDIELLDSQLLEEAKLYLYPTTTYGDALATVLEGKQVTIPVDQAFTMSFYLTTAAYINPTIRPSLIQNAKVTTNEMIQNSTISMSDIVAQLQETSGSEVMALEANGLGGKDNYTILTVADQATRLSVRKKLVVLPNNELTVQDDMTFNFYKHLE